MRGIRDSLGCRQPTSLPLCHLSGFDGHGKEGLLGEGKGPEEESMAQGGLKSCGLGEARQPVSLRPWTLSCVAARPGPSMGPVWCVRSYSSHKAGLALPEAARDLQCACVPVSVCICLFFLWQGPSARLSPEDINLLVKVNACNECAWVDGGGGDTGLSASLTTMRQA